VLVLFKVTVQSTIRIGNYFVQEILHMCSELDNAVGVADVPATAPRLCNGLPGDLHNITSLATFKSCLETHLFKSVLEYVGS